MGLPYLFQASKGEIERTKKIETKLTFIRSPCLGGPNEPSDFGHGLVQMVSESALVVQVEILVKPVHDLLRIAPKKIGRRCYDGAIRFPKRKRIDPRENGVPNELSAIDRERILEQVERLPGGTLIDLQ